MTNNETKTFEERFEEVGAIWKKENGHLSIQLKADCQNGASLIAFENKFANENPKAPQYRVYRGKE